ncbi:hypothetical protein OHA57_04625 [Streptomyces anulatus]|uniref:hypothetical protein n=1 Tax=Streptomyces anulatus TaxID=1892 RepID=UPI002DDB0863|nr:hypothetical protein [Streptomyces anulatus]WSC60063.1 hypothetical protein OHA57_04625 [Streptomyces anulatus]
MITFDHDTSTAQAAVTAARRRKLDVPQIIDDTAHMWQVVTDAGHMRVDDKPGRDDIPDTAEELRQLIEARAHAHRIAEAHRQIAGDYREPVAHKYNQLVRDHAPGWIRALQPDFLALTKVLAKQEKKLPALLDSRHLDMRDPTVSAPWQAAEAAAIQLDQLVSDRQIMARATGQDIGKDAELYAVAKIKEPSSEDVFAHKLRDDIGPARREWQALRHQPVSRWLYLARSPHLELSLATPGEVTERQTVMDRWYKAIEIVMTPGLSRQAAEQAVASTLRG